MKPHEIDGYQNMSSRSYKGYYSDQVWWGNPAIPSADYGLLVLNGSTFEKHLFWEFILEHFRAETELVPGTVTMEFVDDLAEVPGLARVEGLTTGVAGNVLIQVTREIFQDWPDPDYTVEDSHYPTVVKQQLWQILAHEWAHVVLVNASQAAVDTIPALFGKTMDDWDTGDYNTSVREAWCETWKDITLPRQKRLGNNQTQLSIPREKWFAPYTPPPFDGQPFSVSTPEAPNPGHEGPPSFVGSEVHNVILALTQPYRIQPLSAFNKWAFNPPFTTIQWGVVEPPLALYPYDGGSGTRGNTEASSTKAGVVR